jgi:DNA-binding NtrC family response regulator
MANLNGARKRPVVAIINTSVETVELLAEVLAEEGFDTVEAYVIEFKRGLRDLDAFFRDQQPQAVIYDVAIPYLENWRFFQEQVLDRKYLPATCFVVTTTNRTVLDLLIGPNNAIEMVGRPFDLDTIVQAVKRAVASGVSGE